MRGVADRDRWRAPNSTHIFGYTRPGLDVVSKYAVESIGTLVLVLTIGALQPDDK